MNQEELQKKSLTELKSTVYDLLVEQQKVSEKLRTVNILIAQKETQTEVKEE